MGEEDDNEEYYPNNWSFIIRNYSPSDQEWDDTRNSNDNISSNVTAAAANDGTIENETIDNEQNDKYTNQRDDDDSHNDNLNNHRGRTTFPILEYQTPPSPTTTQKDNVVGNNETIQNKTKINPSRKKVFDDWEERLWTVARLYHMELFPLLLSPEQREAYAIIENESSNDTPIHERINDEEEAVEKGGDGDGDGDGGGEKQKNLARTLETKYNQ